MSDGMLLLSWNSHYATFCNILARLREKESFTDVTLACEGKFYPLHKLVLSTCSEYLEQIFEKTPCKHPVIVLNDMKCSELEALLSYMYAGEVSVPQSTLPLLIKAAEVLQVKGLAVPDTIPSMRKKKVNARNLGDDQTSPQAKRQKYEESDTTSHEERSHGSNYSPSSTSSPCSKEISYALEPSNTLSEDIEQEHLDQVVGQHQVSEGSPLGHIETVFVETDIKEEVADNIDNTNNVFECAPEMNYPSHRSSCKVEDTRGGLITKDVCSIPLSEDYEKQPLDSRGISPSSTNVPGLNAHCTESQGWKVEGALGELSRVDGHGNAGFLESSLMTALQGSTQQEQQMIEFSGGSFISKCRGGYNQWSPEERLLIAKACLKQGPSKAAKELSQQLSRKLSESTVRTILKQYQKMMRRGHLKDDSSSLPTARTVHPQLYQDSEVEMNTNGQTTGDEDKKTGIPSCKKISSMSSHSCPHCQYQTAKKYNLMIHIRSHTGEKPYPCPHCPFRSTNRSDLRKHIHNVHTHIA